MTKDIDVISEDTHPDEGNAYARLGRKDGARSAYEKGIGQAEKFGHSGMADDLRLALIQLGE